jgi:hypothetical protein
VTCNEMVMAVAIADWMEAVPACDEALRCK